MIASRNEMKTTKETYEVGAALLSYALLISLIAAVTIAAIQSTSDGINEAKCSAAVVLHKDNSGSNTLDVANTTFWYNGKCNFVGQETCVPEEPPPLVNNCNLP